MKTSELEGAKLDYWVARAEGYTPGKFGARNVFLEKLDTGPACLPAWVPRLIDADQGADNGAWLYSPSTDWEHGGPIIERDRIELHCIDRNGRFLGQWMARVAASPLPLMFGPMPLIAAMRAKVASIYGAEVLDE